MTAVALSLQLDLGRIKHVLCHLAPNPRLVWGRDHKVAEEKYRLLVHRIRTKSTQKQVRRVLVTSAIPGEGKSTTAANRALVLTRNGRRVLLVDADFRVPDIHQFFGLSSEPGLAEVVDGQAELEDAIRCLDPLGLYCLPAGR